VSQVSLILPLRGFTTTAVAVEQNAVLSPLQSKHFSWNIPPQLWEEIVTPRQISRYLAQMDALYEAMQGFTAFTPLGGKININYNPDFDPLEHYATGARGGNRITLSWYAVENTVYEIADGSVYWIVVHELGHNFGFMPTVNREFTADFLALYASVTTGIPLTDWHERTGNIEACIDRWYASELNWIKRGTPNPPHDTIEASILTASLLREVQAHGWARVRPMFAMPTALEILKYLAGMESIYNGTAYSPTIFDAIEILKSLI
jgi:hypothetical protein